MCRSRTSVGFRRLQAAHDLVHLAQRASTGAVERLASGVPSAEMAADVVKSTLIDLIENSGCRFVSDAHLRLHETLLLAATLPDDDFGSFELATIILLADRLRGGRGPDDLYWHWDAFCDHYLLCSGVSRAAIIHGFLEADSAGVIPRGSVRVPPVSAVDVERVRADLRAQVSAASDPELMDIARSDYGDQVAAHRAALDEVINQQGCVLRPEQSWVPSEVIELAAHDPKKLGFPAATAILLVTAMERGDDQGWFDFRWEQNAADYDRFPPRARWAVMSAVRFLYESDPDFRPYAMALFDPVDHRAQLIPHLTIEDRPLSPAR